MNEITEEEAVEQISETENEIDLKHQAKERRQFLKLSCLDFALRVSNKLNANGVQSRMSDGEIVATAKAFYAFVRT